MRKKLKIKFNKIIALLVLSTFLLNLSSPVFASINIETSVTEENKQIFNTLVLPYSYGQITKSHYAGSDRVIINIQDLHCHPKVQKNISSIIELFDKQYGVKNIYLEGVYGEADTSWLADTIKNDKSIAEKLLETGRLTGAEYYSAVSGKTKIIKGLEQKEEYLDNLKRFGAIVENQDRINLILEGIRESSEKIKAKYYDKRQYKLEKLSAKYKEGKITAEKYYTLLNKHIDRLGIDIYKYENTLAYIMLLSMQRELNYKAIMKELQSLLLLFKERLPYDTYMALFEETEGFARADKLQEYIIQITKEYDFDLSVNFKSLDKHLRYLELSRKINPIELVKEEQELSKEINTRFSQTKAQRDVVFMMYFEKYLRDYLNSSITADDYEYYQENIGKYKELWSQYVDNRVLSLLDEYMLEADKFYKINDDRNTYFADFISDSGEVLAIEGKKQAKDDTSKIIANMDEVKRLDIIVTGGFHTDTVSSILKDKGISYIVITPNVKDGAKEAEETYYEIAKEQGKISFQTLATLPLSLYGQEAKVRISVEAFGEEIAKEIFGEKQVRDVMSKPSSFTQDEQNILSFQAQRRQIEFAKILDSDDEGEVSEKIIELVKEYISEDLKDKVSEDLLAKANPAKLEEALSSGQQELDNLITFLSETNPIKKLILSIKSVLPDLKPLFVISGKQQRSSPLIDQVVFVTNVNTGSYEILRVNKNYINRVSNRMDFRLSESSFDSVGLQVDFDKDGNIINVTAKEGFELSSVVLDGEPRGSEENNMPFAEEEIRALMQDTGAVGYADIYLDDDEETLLANMREAILTNKFMVIHVFRKGFDTETLTLSQLYDKYRNAYALLQSDKLKKIFPQISEHESEKEKESIITSDFFLKELLKNCFAHGNNGYFEQPIACYIQTNAEGNISEVVTYNISSNSLYHWSRTLNTLMNNALIFGDHKANEYMGRSILRNLTQGKESLSGIEFYKARSTLKTQEEQDQALLNYNKYNKEPQTKGRFEVLTGREAAKAFWGTLQTGSTIDRLERIGKFLRIRNFRTTPLGVALGALFEHSAIADIFAGGSREAFLMSHSAYRDDTDGAVRDSMNAGLDSILASMQTAYDAALKTTRSKFIAKLAANIVNFISHYKYNRQVISEKRTESLLMSDTTNGLTNKEKDDIFTGLIDINTQLTDDELLDFYDRYVKNIDFNSLLIEFEKSSPYLKEQAIDDLKSMFLNFFTTTTQDVNKGIAIKLLYDLLKNNDFSGDDYERRNKHMELLDILFRNDFGEKSYPGLMVFIRLHAYSTYQEVIIPNHFLSKEAWIHICEGHGPGFNRHREGDDIYLQGGEHPYDFAIFPRDIDYLPSVINEPDYVRNIEGYTSTNHQMVEYVKNIDGTLYSCTVDDRGYVVTFYKVSNEYFKNKKGQYGEIDKTKIQGAVKVDSTGYNRTFYLKDNTKVYELNLKPKTNLELDGYNYKTNSVTDSVGNKIVELTVEYEGKNYIVATKGEASYDWKVTEEFSKRKKSKLPISFSVMSHFIIINNGSHRQIVDLERLTVPENMHIRTYEKIEEESEILEMLTIAEEKNNKTIVYECNIYKGGFEKKEIQTEWIVYDYVFITDGSSLKVYKSKDKSRNTKPIRKSAYYDERSRKDLIGNIEKRQEKELEKSLLSEITGDSIDEKLDALIKVLSNYRANFTSEAEFDRLIKNLLSELLKQLSSLEAKYDLLKKVAVSSLKEQFSSTKSFDNVLRDLLKEFVMGVPAKQKKDMLLKIANDFKEDFRSEEAFYNVLIVLLKELLKDKQITAEAKFRILQTITGASYNKFRPSESFDHTLRDLLKEFLKGVPAKQKKDMLLKIADDFKRNFRSLETFYNVLRVLSQELLKDILKDRNLNSTEKLNMFMDITTILQEKVSSKEIFYNILIVLLKELLKDKQITAETKQDMLKYFVNKFKDEFIDSEFSTPESFDNTLRDLLKDFVKGLQPAQVVNELEKVADNLHNEFSTPEAFDNTFKDLFKELKDFVKAFAAAEKPNKLKDIQERFNNKFNSQEAFDSEFSWLLIESINDLSITHEKKYTLLQAVEDCNQDYPNDIRGFNDALLEKINAELSEEAEQAATMTWLSNLLDILGIYNFDTRQKIINTIENSIIILGYHFPFIKNWFIRQHKGQAPETVEKNIKGILKTALAEVGNSIPRTGIKGLFAMLTNKAFRKALRDAHTEHNRMEDRDNLASLLQTRTTLAKLNERGLKKYLSQYLKQTGKSEEELTEEELAGIQQKAQNYRYTFSGIAHGAFLEIFDFWRADFIDRHDYDSSIKSGMRAVIWRLRALSTGTGILTGLSAAIICSNPITLLAVFPATLITSVIAHFAYNKIQVLRDNKYSLLQLGVSEKDYRWDILYDMRKRGLVNYLKRKGINIALDRIQRNEFVNICSSQLSERDRELLFVLVDIGMLDAFLNLPEEYQGNVERILIINKKYKDHVAVSSFINNISTLLQSYETTYKEIDEGKYIERNIKDLFVENTDLIYEPKGLFFLFFIYGIDEEKSLSEVNTLYLQFKKLVTDKSIDMAHTKYVFSMLLEYGENSKVFDSNIFKKGGNEEALEYLISLRDSKLKKIDESIMFELLPLVDKIDSRLYALLVSSEDKSDEVLNIISKSENLFETLKFIVIVYFFGGKQSKTIKKLLDKPGFMDLLNKADLGIIKSCLEIKYPGMSEEVMSKIINKFTDYSSIDSRIKAMSKKEVQNKTAFILLNSVSKEEMNTIVNIVSEKSPDKINSLFGGLAARFFRSLATDNNCAALELFFDDSFNKLIDSKISESDDFGFLSDDIARYHVAIAISRMVAEKGITRDAASEYYFKLVIEAKNKKLIDSNTILIGLCNNENNGKRFNTKVFESLVGKTIKPEHKFLQTKNKTNAKGDFLKTIAELKEREKKYYILFRGHGFDKGLSITPSISISPQELAENLWKAHKSGINLNNITLDLSCCYSYYFARNLYDALKQIAKGEELAYPTIITAAGLETEFAYTMDMEESMVSTGNLHDALRRSRIKGIKDELTLFDLISMEHIVTHSNITMFVDAGTDIVPSKIQHDEKLSKDSLSRGEVAEDTVPAGEQSETMGRPFMRLPGKLFELSIFKELADKYADNEILSALNKTAPVWEEFLFRAVPAAITLLNPFIGIPMFVIMQPLFVFSHAIVKWIVEKDSAGKSLREFVSEQDFVDPALKTSILSLPYVAALIAAPFLPLPLTVFAAFCVSVIIHAINNYSVKTYKQEVQIKKNRMPLASFSPLFILTAASIAVIPSINTDEKGKEDSMAQIDDHEKESILKKFHNMRKNEKMKKLLVRYFQRANINIDIDNISQEEFIGTFNDKSSENDKKLLFAVSDDRMLEKFLKLPEDYQENIERVLIKNNKLEDSAAVYNLINNIHYVLEIYGSKYRELDEDKSIEKKIKDLFTEDTSLIFETEEIFQLLSAYAIDEKKSLSEINTLYLKFKKLAADKDIDPNHYIYILKMFLKYGENSRVFDSEVLKRDVDEKALKYLTDLDLDEKIMCELLPLTDKIDPQIYELLASSDNKYKEVWNIIEKENLSTLPKRDLSATSKFITIVYLFGGENSRTVRSFYATNDAEFLSKYADIKFVKSCLEIKYPGMSEEIMSKIIEQVTSYYELEFYTNEEKNRNRMAFMFLNSVSEEDMKTLLKIVPGKDFDKVRELFIGLAKRSYRGLATDNDMAPVKLFFDDDFNKMLDNKMRESKDFGFLSHEISRYHTAIAISRMAVEKGMSQEEATEQYFKILFEIKDKKLIDQDTVLIGIYNNEVQEDGKMRFGLDSFEKIIGRTIRPENKFFQSEDSPNAKGDFLNTIAGLNENDKKYYILFKGHGLEKEFRLDKLNSISPEEMAQALWQVHKNGIDLRNVTLDLGSCYSYYFARNLYKALKQKAIAEGQYEEINYPTIITEAGRETEFGYTVDINIEGTTLPSGNFHNALWEFDIDMEEGVSLGALIFLERLSEDSNYTIFVDAGKNNITAFKRQDEEEGMPLKVIEFSILKPLADKYADNKILSALNKTAPVWEEILFRAIPATLILINPFIGIPVFMLMQPLFIFSHTIVRWLVNKDSSGMSLKELAKEDFGIYAPKTALLSFSYLIAVPLAVFSPFFIPAATSIAIIAHAINNSASFSVQTEITEEVVSSTPPDTSEQELESSQQSAEAAGILLMKTFDKYYADNNKAKELIGKDTMSYFSTGSSAIEENDTNEIKAKKQERINIANINKDILDKAKAAGESFSGLMPKKVINALNNLFAGTFSEADSKTIHEYVFEKETEREVRESWIKMFAVLYAYKTWTEQGIWKSIDEGQKENGAEVALSNGIKLSFKETFQHERLIVGEEIILPNGLKLTFERWIHMCDAHSILTNGNVEDANRYADAQEAFNSAIKLEDLIESVGIINEIEEKWDAIAERVENRAVYMKKANNNKPYCLVVDKTNNTMDTLFVIGKAKYENVFKTSVEILIRPGLLKEGEGEGEVNVNVDVDTVNNIIKQGGVFIRVRTDSAGNMQGTSKYEERKNEINKDEAEEKYCIGCDNSRFLFAEDAELYKRIFALDFPYRAAIYKAIHKFDLRVIGVTSDNVLVAYDEGRKSIYLWDIGERRQGDKICKLDRMKRFSLSNSISINVSVNGDKVVLEFKDRNREEIKKIKEIKGTDALNFDYNQFYNTIMDEDIISQGIYTLPITDIVVNSAARSITPSNTAQEISIKIVKGNSSIIELENNIADMSKNLIITENEMSAQKLKGQGFEAVTARVVYERGGEQIGQYNGMNVRAKWNEDKTEILLCLKSLDADVQKEELLRMLVDTLKEGRENNILYGVTQIVITNEQTVDGAVEAIKNTHTDSYMDAIKETKFDLSERNLANNIQTICERESAATGTHIFVMNLLQAQQNQQNILKLKDNGFKFVVSYSSSEEAKAADEILHNGAKVDASDIKNIKDAKDFLFELKNKALKVGAGLFLSVKFNDDIYKDFVEEDIDIFDKYGIIPIVSADSKYLETSILGRMEVEEITEENVDQILENDIVVSIVVDDARVLSDKKEKLKQVKTKEQKYNKGYNASLSSKFDYTTRDIVSLSELLTADINDEESNLKTLWESVSINEIGLSQDTQSYIKYLLERERYEEALGFIRGVAMNSAEKILIDGLADMQIAIKKAEFKSAGNGMFHRAMHTLLVQLLMEGDDINSLLQDDYVLGEITMTAKEYLELIMVKVNKNAENILKDNEYKIKKLSEQDHDKAVFDFQEFNLYVQDKFRERDMVKNVKVSALAVRSILGAA